MKIRYIAVVTLLISSLSTVAVADIYVGMGIGSAAYKVNLETGGDFEDKSTGTKLYTGYTFNKYFAAEVTAYNFSEASVAAIDINPDPDVTEFISASASMKGAGAYAVGMYPVSKRINLMAKLGVLRWNADLAINAQSRTNSGTDAAYGLAASYAFTKEFLATVEWESFNTDNPELSMLSLGFRFNFK